MAGQVDVFPGFDLQLFQKRQRILDNRHGGAQVVAEGHDVVAELVGLRIVRIQQVSAAFQRADQVQRRALGQAEMAADLRKGQLALHGREAFKDADGLENRVDQRAACGAGIVFRR